MDEENLSPSSIKWRTYFFLCRNFRICANDSSTLPEFEGEKLIINWHKSITEFIVYIDGVLILLLKDMNCFNFNNVLLLNTVFNENSVQSYESNSLYIWHILIKTLKQKW